MECGLKREAKERDFGDESKYTVLFTAGTAVLMACLKRFVIMMFFIERWRLWVFFFLNVVLLAIFFTSMHPQQSEDQDVTINSKKPPQGGKSSDHHHHQNGDAKAVKVEEKCEENHVKKLESNKDKKDDDDGEEEEEEEEEETACRLSKEELNKRVEAFIATFRRQLVSDAIRSGKRSSDHNHDHYSFSKKKMMKENTNGGSNFVKLERRSSTRMIRTCMNNFV